MLQRLKDFFASLVSLPEPVETQEKQVNPTNFFLGIRWKVKKWPFFLILWLLLFPYMGNAYVSLGPASSSGSGGGYSTVQDESGALTQRTTINFTGAGVTCADNGGTTVTDCVITGAAGAAYGTIRDEGIALTQRATLNFIGTYIGCVDNAGSVRTDCTLAALANADHNITASTCTNQFVSAISSTIVGTCTSPTLASAQFANQGSTTTLLHGNAAGNPSWSSVVNADHNITVITCTNQFVTGLSATLAGTCNTAVLASAQFANQGTTTTVLHGNGAGNPSFAAVVSADLNITTTTCAGQFVRTISAGAVGGCQAVVIADLPAAIIAASKSVTIQNPTTAASNLIQWEFPSAITLTEISCSTDTGTATIQLDKRARGTPNTAGTNALTSSLVCASTGANSTTFTSSGVSADAPLNLQITAVASTPTIVRIHIQYTVN